MTTEAPPVDTAALAANDDTNVKSIGDHLDAAAQAVTDQPAAGQDSPANPPATTGEVAPTTGENAPEAVPVNPEPPPEIPSAIESRLMAENAALRDRLRYFEDRRSKEQSLLAQRDSALAAIEGAKARVQSCKGELAEVEEEIAALLKSPVPMAFEATPIGRVIAEAEQEEDDDEEPTEPAAPEPPPVPAWESLLPAVGPDAVKLLDAAAGDELPTVDALCGALLAPQAMMGGKRVLKQSVQVYGTPWIVTHLWKDEASGACRANVVRLYTKDEWQQSCEAKFGRAVGDFDQSDEAKAQRQAGGEWCGLVVKVSRKVYVVGPQADALHLAYCPPEPAQAVAETIQPAAEGTQEQPEGAQPEPWADVIARARDIIAATGMDPAAYALQYNLPQVALVRAIESGEEPTDPAIAAAIAKGFPPFEEEPAELPWTEVAARIGKAVAASGQTVAAYAKANGLPYAPLHKVLSTGEPSGSDTVNGIIYGHAETLPASVDAGTDGDGPKDAPANGRAGDEDDGHPD